MQSVSGLLLALFRDADARLRSARRDGDGIAAGWRGHGAKDHVDHPDTTAPTAEVAARDANGSAMGLALMSSRR